jgi:hypothetical protein
MKHRHAWALPGCALALGAILGCSDGELLWSPATRGGGGSAGALDPAGLSGGGGTAGTGATTADDATSLAAACTPAIDVEMLDTGPGAALFARAVPRPKELVEEVGRAVCRILYRRASEVRVVRHLTLILRDDPTAGREKGDGRGNVTVMLSTRHLLEFADQGGDVANEITGSLHHEMTHVFQNDDRAPGEGTYANLVNVLEGVADFVRIRAGYLPPSPLAEKRGSWDDEPYAKPAFFLLWVDDAHPDFLRRMNRGLLAGDGVAWTPAAIEPLAGETVDALWAEYQGAACCAEEEHECCH